MTVVLPSSTEEGTSGDAATRVVLKVHNGVESANVALLRAQNNAMAHLAKHGFRVPTPVAALTGEYDAVAHLPTVDAAGAAGDDADESKEAATRSHIVRMLRFVPGTMMSDVTPDVDLLFKVRVGDR